MFAFVKRTFWIILGLLLIVVFVWNAGPYFTFGRYRPLETETARLIAIGGIVGWWLLVRLVKRLRAFRASDRLLGAVIAQPQPEPARPSADAVKLRERFEEAVTTLKQQRRSGHSLYELPWFVIIGAPGSGKTTALLNSGLTFPLEQRVGKGALRGVGGTRNCDWWFTDEAIFLDTAGRYTTQDSDAASDSAGWTEFLALLRKYRARRPVNGVILTISAQDLILQGAAARDAHVAAARHRLDELNRELRIELPVYLMVTKCDLVDGFAEYFEDLTAAGRAQVWGVTFPYEQTLRNEGPLVFPEEFDALMARLNERVFARIEEVREPRRRTRVFAFPQQMAALRDALTQFVSDVFVASQFDRQTLLRGVYFTSATQDGTPIDRLLGSIGRRFGAGDAVIASLGPGKSFFVEHLLKGVLIGESGLAGVNRRLEARKAAAQLGAYAATGIIAASGVAALTVSYNRNRDFLQRTAKDVAALERVAPVTPTAPFTQMVPRLDAIRAVVDSSDVYRDSTAWATRWGLYQGGSIGNSARDAYLRELDSILLPRFAAQMRARVIQYESEPDRLYPYFKGYLMLTQPRHLDKTHLQTLAAPEWKQAGPLEPALSRHFASLLESGDTFRAIPPDGKLVAQSRSTLLRTSMPKILYDTVKRTYADNDGGPRPDHNGGLRVEVVFRRASGTPLSTPIPGLYSKPVFKEIAGEGRAVIVKWLAEDEWIWGDNVSALTSAGPVVGGVISLYEQDYIRAWYAFLSDLEFVPQPTIAQTSDAFGILTSQGSPLRGILQMVAENTALAEVQKGPAASGVVGQAKKKFGDLMKPIQEAAGLPTGEPGRLVTAEFQWVRQLTAGETGKTPLDDIIRSIGEIQQQLGTLGPDLAGADATQILSSPTFRSLLQKLRQQAGDAPSVLRPLLLQIARAAEGTVTTDATRQVERMYTQEVVPACRNVIDGRYPFAAATEPEVQLTDFGTVFGYDGLFDRFFKDNLAAHVISTGTSWTWRPGSISPPPRLLDQIQAALRMRDMFFAPGSKMPEVRFAMTLADLDPGANRFILEMDGQRADLKRGAPTLWQWVWPGQVGHVQASFEALRYDLPTRYSGPWAWIKMIDAMGGPPDAQQRVRLEVKDKYHQASVTIEAARAGYNPFATAAWRQFRCES